MNRLQTLCRPKALGLAVGLFLAANMSVAAEPKLRVVSAAGGSATTERVLPLRALVFAPGTRQLSAETRAGNVVCGTPGPVTGMSVRFDGGASYPIIVNQGSLPTGLTSPIDYTISSGNVSLALNGLLSSDCVTSNVYGTGEGPGSDPDVYDIEFPGQVTRTIAEAVYFDVSARRFEVRVADPILCTSYASSGLTVALADPNDLFFDLGASELLQGISGLEFDPATLTLSPASTQLGGGAALQCSTPGAVVLPTPGSGGGDSIFVGDFEDGSALNAPDLIVTLEDLGGAPLTTLNAIPGQSFGFRVRIENIGDGAAQGVRLREFVPLVGGIHSSALVQGGVTDTCERFGGSTSSCGLDGLSFPIREDEVSVGVGESLLLTLSRRFADGVVPGPAADMGYAAFVSAVASGTADANITDNGRWTTSTPISNQPPVISTITMAAFDEDGIGTATFTVTDAEGDPVATPTATSNNQTTLPNGGISITPLGGNSYELSVTPAENKNGAVTVTVSATDGNSAPVNQPVAVSITAVNDPPVFVLTPSAVAVPTCGIGPPCQFVVTSFVTAIAPGPATATDESGQTLEVERDGFNQIACSVLPGGFFGGAPGPQLLQNGANWNLAMLSIGSVSGQATCEITVHEVSEPASTTTQSFTVSYP